MNATMMLNRRSSNTSAINVMAPLCLPERWRTIGYNFILFPPQNCRLLAVPVTELAAMTACVLPACQSGLVVTTSPGPAGCYKC